MVFEAFYKTFMSVSTPAVAPPISQKTTLTAEEDSLIEDIQLLSDILADTVNRNSPRIHDLYLQFRKYGLTR